MAGLLDLLFAPRPDMIPLPQAQGVPPAIRGLLDVGAAPAGGFDAIDTPPGAGGDPFEAAAQRVRGAVRRPNRWPDQAPIPAVGEVAGLLQGGGNMGEAPTLPGGVDEAGFMPEGPLQSSQGVDEAGFTGFRMAPGESRLPAGATPTVGRAAPGAGGGGGPSFLNRLLDPDKALTWMALASGFSGAGSIGTGMRRAGAAAVPAMAMDRAQSQKKTSQNLTYRALVSRGMPPAEAEAAVQSPELMKAAISKYFETKSPINVNNRLVRERPDGTVETIADFSEEKAPAGYAWAPDGSTLKYVKGGPADPEVKRALGERSNAPPGYAWVDPADPEKGLKAIIGGPAEKVDAQVAARLGLANSFLGQLPDIRKRIARGDATGPWDAAMAKLGVGEAGELRRQIQSGAEALLRNLTGAGMNLVEAEKYISRYELQPTDTIKTVESKLNQLERELHATIEAVGKGRGGVSGGHLMTRPAGKTKSGLEWSIE